jgi:hypothetical protein
LGVVSSLVLRLIRGGVVARREQGPVTISADSDNPEMTPTLAKVFVGIFQRLASEERAVALSTNEVTAA